MNLPAYILAAKELNWIEIVVIAIVFGLYILGSIFQKAKAKREEDESRKPREESEPSDGRQTQAPATRTVQPTRPVPPAAPSAARPRQTPAEAEQTVRVSEELRLRQQRQARLDRDRKKRLATRTSPESDTDAIESRLVSVRPEEADTAPRRISEVGIILNLETPADAQRAIILHEIFSPPKALRQGGEMWDT